MKAEHVCHSFDNETGIGPNIKNLVIQSYSGGVQ